MTAICSLGTWLPAKSVTESIAALQPIVDCIRQMRLEGCADNQISDLLRHAANELDEATMTKDGEVDPAD
jgi:hypothetical protein